MSLPPRDFAQWMAYVNRTLTETKRNAQASVAGQINREIAKVEDQIKDVGDPRTPAAPVEIVVQTYILPDESRINRGYLSLDFPPVDVATDATPLEVVSYEMWGRRIDNWDGQGEGPAFDLMATSASPSLMSGALITGATYEARARAIGKTTTKPGLLSEPQVAQILRDTTPPPIPSQLVLSQNLSVVKGVWDGLDSTGAPMPADFAFVEPRITTPSGTFAIEEFLTQAGSFFDSSAPYDVTVSYSHRAVDSSGNKSGWSIAVPIIVKSLVDSGSIADALQEVQDNINAVAGDLSTVGQELNTRLDAAEQDLANSNTRLTAAEAEIDDAFIQIGSADSKAQAAQDAANTAKSDAATAAGIANGKGDVLIQTATPPTAMRKATTLWIDTTGGANTPKRWSGTAWVAVTDKAAIDAANAAAAADSKAQTAINDAKAASDKADAAIRQAPSLYEWTRDYTTTNSSSGQMVKTDDEISYNGAAPVSSSNRITTGSKMLAPNRVYRIQAIVSNTGTANARFQAGFYLNNASGYVQSLWPSDQYTTVPAGASRMAVHSTPRIGEYPANTDRAATAIYLLDQQPMVVHDVKVIDITDIISAQETADSALVMAGSKTTVFYSTSNASGSASLGDIWRKVDAQKNVVAEWYWSTANKWESSMVTTTMISNLDVGKLTAGSAAIDGLVAQKIAASTATFQTVDAKNLYAGTGTFQTAVVNKMWAEVVNSRLITAQMIAVGASDNMIKDPNFTNSGDLWGTSSIYSYPAGQGRNGVDHALRIHPDNTQSGRYCPDDIQANTGDHFRVSVWVKSTVALPANTLGLYVNFKIGSALSSTSPSNILRQSNGTSLGNDAIAANTWTLLTATTETATTTATNGMNQPNLSSVRFGFYRQAAAPSTANIYFSEANATRMAGGKLIVDGAVEAVHITASESLSAKVGTFLKVSAGMILANAVTSDKINAGAITAVKVATDAITSDKILANSVTAGKINVDAVTAREIKALTITSAQIAANTITAGQINASSVAAGVGEFIKIKASQITVGDFTSLTPSLAADPDQWILTGGAGVIDWSLASDGKGIRLTDAASGQGPRAYGPFLQTMPGEKWFGSVVFGRYSGSTSNFEMRLYWYGPTKNYIGSSLLASNSASESGTLTGVGTAPANSVYARYGLRGNTSTASGWISVRDMDGYRQSGGTRIEDDAITTGKIFAGAITGAKISGDAIDGKTITGAIVRTNDSAATVGGMQFDRNWFRAWDSSGTQTFSLGANGSFWVKGDIRSGSTITGATITGGTVEMAGTGGSSGYRVTLQTDSSGGVINLRTPLTTTAGNIRAVVSADSQTNGASQLRLRSPATSAFPHIGHLTISSWRGNGSTTDQALITTNADLMFDQYAGIYGVAGLVLSGKDTFLYLNDDTAGPRAYSMAMYNRTYTAAANMHITNAGTIGRSTSTRAAKLRIEDWEPDEDSLLGLRYKWWFDKADSESVANYYQAEMNGELKFDELGRAIGDDGQFIDVPEKLRRIPGMIAEEVEDAGLGEFVHYDIDGNIAGIMYERIALALLPVVKRLKDRVVEAESGKSEMMEAIRALTSRVDSLEEARN